MLTEDQIRSCAQYVLDQARYVCREFGDRDPGSAGEVACQAYVRGELQPHVDNEVQMEAFQVAPKAFMGFQRVAGSLLLIGFAGYWLMPWLALMATTLAIVVVVQELVRYKLFIDPLFPKRTSYNVMGLQKPSGETKRRIIINGHADAAYEWRFHHWNPKFLHVFIPYSLLGLLAIFAASLLCVMFNNNWPNGYENAWGLMGLGLLAFLPGAVLSLFYSNFSVVAPGANDNLSGAFIAVGLAKWLRAAGVQLENTEIMYLVTGSEEAGLRGAKVYAKRHKKSLLDMETAFVALDTIRDLDHLKVYHRDMNGIVRHDARLCALFKEAGKRAGLDLPYGVVTVGSSDATAFTQEGIPSVALCAMDPAPAYYYHTRKDTPDIMNQDCVEKTIAVILEALQMFDDGGLAGR